MEIYHHTEMKKYTKMCSSATLNTILTDFTTDEAILTVKQVNIIFIIVEIPILVLCFISVYQIPVYRSKTQFYEDDC